MLKMTNHGYDDSNELHVVRITTDWSKSSNLPKQITLRINHADFYRSKDTMILR